MKPFDKLEGKIFIYDSSESDRRFFMHRIQEFLFKGGEPGVGKSFTQWMFYEVWKRNGKGQFLKYCDFDDHAQKVRLKKAFYDWMVLRIRQMSKEVEIINSLKTIIQ